MSFCDAFFVFLHRDRIYASDEREQDEIFLNISRKQWPDWPGWHSVDAITKEFAADHEKLISELSSNQILLSHAREFFCVSPKRGYNNEIVHV